MQHIICRRTKNLKNMTDKYTQNLRIRMVTDKPTTKQVRQGCRMERYHAPDLWDPDTALSSDLRQDPKPSEAAAGLFAGCEAVQRLGSFLTLLDWLAGEPPENFFLKKK